MGLIKSIINCRMKKHRLRSRHFKKFWIRMFSMLRQTKRGRQSSGLRDFSTILPQIQIVKTQKSLKLTVTKYLTNSKLEKLWQRLKRKSLRMIKRRSKKVHSRLQLMNKIRMTQILVWNWANIWAKLVLKMFWSTSFWIRINKNKLGRVRLTKKF